MAAVHTQDSLEYLMTKTTTNDVHEQYFDQFEDDLDNYVQEILRILKSKGLTPLHCVQTITPDWISGECKDLSWLMAEKILFLELKNKINEISFDNDFSFLKRERLT